MNQLKKLLALGLAGALLFALTACQEETTITTGQGDIANNETTTAADGAEVVTVSMTANRLEPSNLPFEETLLYGATTEMRESGEYSVTMSFEDENNDIHIQTLYVKDGAYYVVHDGEIASVMTTEAMYGFCTQLEVWWETGFSPDEIGGGVDVLSFEGENLTLLGFGEADFCGDILTYEEFIESDMVVRYFFDTDGEIVGIRVMGAVINGQFDNGDFEEEEIIRITITAGIPEDVLDSFPNLDDAISYEEYMEQFMASMGGNGFDINEMFPDLDLADLDLE